MNATHPSLEITRCDGLGDVWFVRRIAAANWCLPHDEEFER
jgi:hypothetical protein